MERSIWIATLLLYGLVLVLAAGACGSVTPVRDSAGAPDGNGPDGGAAAVDAGPPELPPSLDVAGDVVEDASLLPACSETPREPLTLCAPGCGRCTGSAFQWLAASGAPCRAAPPDIVCVYACAECP